MADFKINDNEKIASPCIRNCCLDDQDVCAGCFRTIKEICAWSNLDNNGRSIILENAQARKGKGS